VPKKLSTVRLMVTRSLVELPSSAEVTVVLDAPLVKPLMAE